MTGPRPQRKTRLVWLSRLLLVVIAGLGVMGLTLLKQDRRQATQDAEIVAQALANSLARESHRQISQAIEQFAVGAAVAHDALIRLAYAIPGEETNSPSAFAQFPMSTLRTLPRPQCYVRDGGASNPPDFPETPQPPAWLLTTPRDLMAQWEAIERSALTSGKVPDEMGQFQMKLNQARPLQANVQLLFALLADGPNDKKASRLAHLPVNPDDATPAGAQIADVGLYRAVQLADSEKTFGELLTQLVGERFRHPSFMTERILAALTARVQANHPALMNRVEAAHVLWGMDQRMRPILKDWREHGRRRAQIVNGEDDAEAYFVFGQPSPYVHTNITVNHALATAVTNVTSGKDHIVTIIPRLVIANAVRRSASESGSRWPGYLVAELELLGQRFVATPGMDGTTPRWDSQPVLATKTESLNGSVGPCLLTITVRLGDSDLLYAKQRQRLLLFSALIVLATTIAAIGAWQLQNNLEAQFALNEQKSNFVSSVSHELRAPIASVRLMAESLERGKISEPAKQNEYFRFIGQECRRLSSLIENVLDFSRIEQGRKQYEFEPTDIGALVEQTVKLMAPYATEKGVRLNAECGVRRAELNVDGRAIQQALVNLIDNAIKHSPKDATVTVSLATANADSESQNPNPKIRIEDEGRERGGAELRVTRHPPLVILSVTDQGPGIPASEHEKIFERFYRLGSELRRETPGVGIGLSIVKHVVEAHGGRVRVASEVGQGSRFTIELPVETTETQS